VGREGGNDVESGGYGRRMRGVRNSAAGTEREGERNGREWKRESNVIKRSRCLAKEGKERRGKREREREREREGEGRQKEEQGDQEREWRDAKQRKDAREEASKETREQDEKERERESIYKRRLKGGNDKTVENARLERSRWERLSYYPEGHLINMAIFLLAFGEASERERERERESGGGGERKMPSIMKNVLTRLKDEPKRGQGARAEDGSS